MKVTGARFIDRLGSGQRVLLVDMKTSHPSYPSILNLSIPVTDTQTREIHALLLAVGDEGYRSGDLTEDEVKQKLKNKEVIVSI